ncbi:sensor domain-containing diguanylate cyclase [Proteinivorax hydrogeniformans]|uniref:Sensor domain-containing diguanylate cyclase n=1 Tax=Proteinivorax hydrogeniformans TaxID=1826727 RepID=A0AAU8HTF5_9FIRM
MKLLKCYCALTFFIILSVAVYYDLKIIDFYKQANTWIWILGLNGAILLAGSFLKKHSYSLFKQFVLLITLAYCTAFVTLVQSTASLVFFLIFIAITLLAYGLHGGFVSYLITLPITYGFYLKIDSMDFLAGVLILSVGNVLLMIAYHSITNDSLLKEKWLENLHKKINELSLLKEINIFLQHSKSLQKTTKIFLTAVTAGYGLGFNRAILFMVDSQDGNACLRADMAIGPLTTNQAYKIWGSLVREHTKLNDVIAIEDHVDLTLNEYIKDISIPFDEENDALIRCVKEKRPYNIKNNNLETLHTKLKKLGFINYAAVPLTSKNEVLGVVLVDNKFNNKPILEEDVESLVAFSNQAALGIDNLKMYQQIKNLANMDGLTGLYNHRFFKTMLEEKSNKNEPYSLLVIDVDDFKQFNEDYGHACGDLVLKKVAQVLNNIIGDKGIASRYGGDEFTIILPSVSKVNGRSIAYSIKKAIKPLPKELQIETEISLSIGVAEFPVDATDFKEIFDVADSNLLASKHTGKDKITY